MAIVYSGVIEFLSTLSLRRATPSSTRKLTNLMISIHALLAESDDVNNPVLAVTSISIHALLAESDGVLYCHLIPIKDFYPRSPCGERHDARRQTCQLNEFLSTLSLRRATALGLPGWLRTLISIHALLAESDLSRVNRRSRLSEFLSTLSLRRATLFFVV